MGDVPKERVSIGDKPFLNTGIDYFGSYHVKINEKTRSNAGTANLPKGDINKICSHTRGSNFTFLLTLSRFKKTF